MTYRISISKTGLNEENASLYVPANGLLEKLGYIINYDDVKNTIDLIAGNSSQEVVDNIVSEANFVINLANNTNQKNVEVGCLSQIYLQGLQPWAK